MISFLILFFSTALGGWFFPWWWPAFVGYGVGIWYTKSALQAFLTGLISTALSWLLIASYIDFKNHHLLANRIAEMFHLPGYLAVLFSTALIGGLCGALGTWTGFFMGKYIRARLRVTPLHSD